MQKIFIGDKKLSGNYGKKKKRIMEKGTVSIFSSLN